MMDGVALKLESSGLPLAHAPEQSKDGEMERLRDGETERERDPKAHHAGRAWISDVRAERGRGGLRFLRLNNWARFAV